MGRSNRIVVAGALLTLLLVCLAAGPAWAGARKDGGGAPATWSAWLHTLLDDLWSAPDALMRLIGREGPGMDPNGTPATGTTDGSATGVEADPGPTNLIGREGPGMDPDGTPATNEAGGSTVSTSGISPTGSPVGS